MRVCVLSANLGGYDNHVDWAPQVAPDGVTIDVFRLTDATFPGREKAMRPALKCAIPKMCGFELYPGYDVYVWVDASRGLLRSDSVAWFLKQLGAAEMLCFRHPERATIREEYEFVKARLARPGETYLTSRYAGEWLDQQYAAVSPLWYVDAKLYASTAFAYRPTLRVKKALRDWFFHKARYLLHDQLALPFVLRNHEVHLVESTANVYACEYFPITRAKR